MRSLSASDSTLVIQAPTWIGILLVAVAVALAAVVLVRPVPRPARLGAFLGTIVLLLAGWHLLATRVTFEPRGFYIEGMYGEEERVGWLRVGSVDAGGITGAKGAEPGHLVLQLRSSREVSVDLSGLDADEQARVVAYVRARLSR